MTELHGVLLRHRTPEARNPDGTTTVTIQRCCNGCGLSLGDVTDAEVELAIGGLPLPDVRKECPACRPPTGPPLPEVPRHDRPKRTENREWRS